MNDNNTTTHLVGDEVSYKVHSDTNIGLIDVYRGVITDIFIHNTGEVRYSIDDTSLITHICVNFTQAERAISELINL